MRDTKYFTLLSLPFSRRKDKTAAQSFPKSENLRHLAKAIKRSARQPKGKYARFEPLGVEEKGLPKEWY